MRVTSFGYSVAINGNYVLIGAIGTSGAAGQAHLFDATNGDLLQTFDNPTPTSIDRFGYSVAVDGNNVLIGAVGDDTNGSNVGQAYLFEATNGALITSRNMARSRPPTTKASACCLWPPSSS